MGLRGSDGALEVVVIDLVHLVVDCPVFRFGVLDSSRWINAVGGVDVGDWFAACACSVGSNGIGISSWGASFVCGNAGVGGGVAGRFVVVCLPTWDR